MNPISLTKISTVPLGNISSIQSITDFVDSRIFMPSNMDFEAGSYVFPFVPRYSESTYLLQISTKLGNMSETKVICSFSNYDRNFNSFEMLETINQFIDELYKYLLSD